MLLDVRDRVVVIVGGGEVAARKARGLIAAGGKRLCCVALEFDTAMPREVERIAEAFAPWHLEGAGLVFAATDSPAVNDAVVEEAHRRGLLVNRADVDEELPGDFTTPAVWTCEGLLLAVSAGGSAALAAKIRNELVAKIEPGCVKMAQAMQELRPMIRQAVTDIARRREIFRELASDGAIDVLEKQGIDGLKKWVKEKTGT
jgi:siroheme synthase-like protein